MDNIKNGNKRTAHNKKLIIKKNRHHTNPLIITGRTYQYVGDEIVI